MMIGLKREVEIYVRLEELDEALMQDPADSLARFEVLDEIANLLDELGVDHV